MRFFFSGELDTAVVDAYRPVRKKVEARLNAELASKSYGQALEEIFLAPIIVGPEFLSERKERRLVKRKEKTADYRLFIDHRAFVVADNEERESLLVQNLREAVQDIQRKLGSHFEGDTLLQDLAVLFPARLPGVS